MGYFGSLSATLNDGSAILVRDLEESEAQQLLSLLENLAVDGEGQILLPQEIPMMEVEPGPWIHAARSHPNEIFLGVFQGPTLVGFLEVRNFRRRRLAHVVSFSMGITREWRQRGVGKFLLSAMIQWLREYTEIEKIHLEVNGDNSAALALYKRFGFQEEGRKRLAIKYAPGHYTDEVLMGLSIKRE